MGGQTAQSQANECQDRPQSDHSQPIVRAQPWHSPQGSFPAQLPQDWAHCGHWGICRTSDRTSGLSVPPTYYLQPSAPHSHPPGLWGPNSWCRSHGRGSRVPPSSDSHRCWGWNWDQRERCPHPCPLFLTANMNFTSTKDIKAVCDSVGDTLTLVSGLISNVWGRLRTAAQPSSHTSVDT